MMPKDIEVEFSKLLNSISTLDDEETRAAIDRLLPLGLDNLKSLTRSERCVALKLLQVIMNSCTNFYDERGELNDFLRLLLISLSGLLNKNIDALNTENNLNGNLAVELVQENIEILNCLLNLVSQLSSNDRIKVDYINCVPGTIVEVLIVVFKDCRSKNEISELSSSLVEQYVTVYRKSTELYTTYVKLVSENLIIDHKYEDQMELLISVFEGLLDVGKMVAATDLKTISQHWKGYVKLSKLYSTYIRDRLNISKPISQLVNNIMDIMNHISSMVHKKKNGDTDVATCIQNLKIASFFLKILIALCEYYVDYLGDCGAIIRLIFGIYKCTHDCEEHCKVAEVKDNVRLHLTVAVAPLITQLTSDRSFIQEYVRALGKDICNNSATSDDKVTVVVSVMPLLQALEQVTPDTQLLWIRSEPSILQTVFSLTVSCENELLKPSLCTPTLRSQNGMTLYDALLIRFARFIISIKTPDFFEQFERIMLRHVLQPQPLVALFASDLWIIIARFGNARLCKTHYDFLSNLLLTWPKNSALLCEKIYLQSLVDRLFPLLTEKQKSSLNNSQLSLHLEQLPIVTVEQIIRDNNMMIKIQQVNCALKKPEEENKLQIYDKMIELLKMKGFVESSEYLITLLEVLQRVDNAIILRRYESNVAFNYAFERLFLDTVVAISRLVHLMSTEQLYSVIKLFIKTVRCSGKLVATTFLDSLSKHLNTIDIRKLSPVFGYLFKTLLLDENPIIHIKSLEVFRKFVSCANYTADIIPMTFTGNNLSSIVGDYMNGKPRNIPIQITFHEFLKYLHNLQLPHKCVGNQKRKIERGNELVKKVKLNNESDIEVTKRNSYDALDYIEMYYAQCSKEEKKVIIRKFTNLLEKFQKDLPH